MLDTFSKMRWGRSEALLARARKSLAGGVSSPFRAKSPVPLYCADGRGSRLQDVDSHWYIDYALAWGPLILGHCHPRIVEAVTRQAGLPHIYGAQHEMEFEVAEHIQSLVPCAERVAFTSSGSEAVQLALRLARAYTGREKIVKFEGHYHGWMDSVLISYHPSELEVGPSDGPHAVLGSQGQVGNAVENVVITEWNSIERLERVFSEHGVEIAAVIMEPVLCNSGCIMPDEGYLQAVRELCNRHGALLIFDEIITGFRLHIGGAQTYFGVTPDLATFGKAIAGGLPLSAIVGPRDLMEQLYGGGVSFGGTFNGNPLSLAGAKATLGELAQDSGALLQQANSQGEKLMSLLCEAAERHQIPLRVSGFGAAFALHFTEISTFHNYRDTFGDDRERLQQVIRLALARGVYLLADGRVYVSAVHTDEDIDETAEAFEHVFSRLAG